MSAVEKALTELLWAHGYDGEGYCDCGQRVSGYVDDTDSWQRHVSSTIAAAIRSWPAEQVAELIGGKVEKATKTRWVDGSGSTFWDFSEAEEYAAKASTWGDGPVTVYPVRRVITSWTPDTSPAVLGLRKIEPEREQQ